MKNKFSITRRHFLHGLGATCFLPRLNAMPVTAEPNKRICAMFHPFGVSLPLGIGKRKRGNREELKKWQWFPEKPGKLDQLKLADSFKSLEGVKDQFSILGGLSHPQCRWMAHSMGDIYLTGAAYTQARHNHQSMDQVAADHLGKSTRLKSLVLSAGGTVGVRKRIMTLSWDGSGHPIPAINSPRNTFELLFVGNAKISREDQLKRLYRQKKIVDVILQDYKGLQRKLGKQDLAKMDEYLTAVNELETKIMKIEKFSNKALPRVDRTVDDYKHLKECAPEEYYDMMYDLIYLAFETNQTNVATFMIGSEEAGDLMAYFSARQVKGNIHKFTHTNKFEQLGLWDQFLLARFRSFLDKMSKSRDEHGSLLDNTIVLHGCATSTLHWCEHYPTIIAGGKNLGYKHGHYHEFPSSVPFSNLFVSMLTSAGVPVTKYHDSTGRIEEIFG